MNKRPERNFNGRDEPEMPAFYARSGISKDTTEAVIDARRNNKPAEQDNEKAPLKGKKRKTVRVVVRLNIRK